MALNALEAEILSLSMQSVFDVLELPSNTLIKKINNAIKDVVVDNTEPNLQASVGEVRVSVLLVRDMSPNDPYVVIESTTKKTVLLLSLMRLTHTGLQ